MLAPGGCHECGKPLNPHGHRPAELYAGTYTGLCYSCQASGPRPLYVELLDRATWIEYPPHCPSHSRSRETFVTYADCPDCRGEGRVVVSRPVNCTRCWSRWQGHPVRKRDTYTSRTYSAAQAVYDAELKRRRLYRKARKSQIPDPVLDLVKAPILARHKRVLSKARAHSERQLMRAIYT
jgi:hypothetical protein